MPMYLPALLRAAMAMASRHLDRRVAFVEGWRRGRNPGRGRGELGEVVGADGETVEVLEELVGQQRVGGISHIMMSFRPFSPR